MANQVLIQVGGRGHWLSFRDPVRVIEAHRIGDVPAALRTVEELVEKRGLHAAGFVSYEAAPAFDAALRTRTAASFPLLWFGIYLRPQITKLPLPPAGESSYSWVPSISEETYRQGVARIKDYIARGDTYQVNYTFRLAAAFSGAAESIFLKMNRAQMAEYGAFIDTGRYAICSASPELFFLLNGHHLSSRPMKGTAARGRTLQEDIEQAARLHNSEKNRAENLMIVDMIRNDLGRVARTGSVRVPRLFEIERYPTVFQMTSTVTASSPASFADIMASLFPCASVTGAPKPRTMEIIAELEQTPRRIYTGCIGFLSPGRQAQFNIAIRTVLIDRERKRAEYGVGGGILWDSTVDDEYEECRIKARVLTAGWPEFSLLETILWTPDRGYYLLERHLARLRDSAAYFGFSVDLGRIRELLISRGKSRAGGSVKIRLLLNREGEVSCEETGLSDISPSGRLRIRLASSPVDINDPFLYHKTTHRRLYQSARAAWPDYDDVLLWNQRGEITETTIANIVVASGGKLITPPLACGLLPGIARGWLLAQGKIREGVITREEAGVSEKIFLINSVRGWRRADLELT